MERNAGMLAEIHTKANQHCQAEYYVVNDREWFATGVHS